MDHQASSGPNGLEAREYYHGLPSKPRLVARTSTTVWTPPRPPTLPHGHGSYYTSPPYWTPGSLVKRLGPIGRGRAGRWGTQLASNDPADEPHHPLVLAWSTVLRDALVAALATSPLCAAWSALLPVRVTAQWRYADPNHTMPDTISDVVLFVAVQPDSNTTWEMALSAAQACRRVLHRHGVMEVEVEVLEAAVLSLADDGAARPSTPVSNPAPVSHGPAFAESAVLHRNLDNLVEERHPRGLVQYRVMRALLPFRSRPGRLLERVEAGPGGSWVPAGTGALGLHVGLGDAPGEKTPIFALTSRHVALGDAVPPDHTWIATSAAAAAAAGAPRVRWGTQDALLGAVRVLGYYAEVTRTRASGAMRRSDHDEVQVNEAVRDLEFANGYIPRVEEAMRDIAAAASSDAIRDIGHVAYAAQQRHGAQNNGWSDWALIQLNEASADAVRHRSDANSVFVGLEVNEFLCRHERSLPGFPISVDGDGFVQLHHRQPACPAPGASARPPQLVMKRGAKTHVRVGVLGEVEAVVRRPLGDGQFRVAIAQVVFDFKGDLNVEDPDSVFGVFSRPGDSGSAVFDSTGGIIGIADGGIGSKNQEEAAAAAAAVLRPLHGMPLKPTPRLDVTLVTPIDWVLQEIQAVTGKVPRIL